MAGLKYAKYIVTEPGTLPQLPAQAKMIEDQKKVGNYADIIFTPTIHDSIVKGSFSMMGGWTANLKGTKQVQMELAHTHDYDEVLGFTGSDIDNPKELGGEIELWLEDEKYIINKSCLIFIPKGMKHCPLSIRRVDRPFFGFAAGLTNTYTRAWEEEYK